VVRISFVARSFLLGTLCGGGIFHSGQCVDREVHARDLTADMKSWVTQLIRIPIPVPPQILLIGGGLLGTPFESLLLANAVQLLHGLVLVIPLVSDLKFGGLLASKRADRISKFLARLTEFLFGFVHFLMNSLDLRIPRDLRTCLGHETLQLELGLGRLVVVAGRALHLRMGQGVHQASRVKRMSTLDLNTGLGLKFFIPKVLQVHFVQTQRARHYSVYRRAV
jgi:hypothetical protein